MLLAQIKNVLHDCRHQYRCTCTIRSSYEQVSGDAFRVLDVDDTSQTPCRVVYGDNTAQLIVVNNSGEDISFIKLDKCLLDETTRKCDCMLLNSSQVFLVEIKNSASGSRGTKRREAANQLGDTIELFRNNNIDLSLYNTKAIICFKHSSLRPTQPSLNTKRAIFLEKYNISLEEGNEVTFSNGKSI